MVGMIERLNYGEEIMERGFKHFSFFHLHHYVWRVLGDKSFFYKILDLIIAETLCTHGSAFLYWRWRMGDYVYIHLTEMA